MGGVSKLLMLLAAPFPHLYRRSSALRLASLSPAAASVARRRRLLSTASRALPDLSANLHTHAAAKEAFVDPSASQPLSSPSAGLPWPEWSRLLDHIAAGGYANRPGTVGGPQDELLDRDGLQDAFLKAAEACLGFARARPELLRSLPKKDLEVIVENGSPFLFKNGDDSIRRMRSFLSGGDNNVLESERAETVDLIRYLLSYLCSSHDTLDPSNSKAKELTDASVRNLLAELVNVGAAVRASSFTESTPRDLPLQQHEPPFFRPPGKNIELKRGDWICPKCSFMNFARNMKCLECNEVRPKRVLTGGEWECPQCDFFNYGRNMSCLRCDCKRPGDIPMSSTAVGAGWGFNRSSNFDKLLHESNTDKSEIESKLAASDEKAQRWFSKVSQLDDSSDLSSLAADEDFPEIMPMRKGENRFVVSTRKTPLERRLANYNSNSRTAGPPEGSGSQPGGMGGIGSDRSSSSPISQTLDRILGRSTATSGTNNQPSNGETNAGTGNRFYSSEYRQNLANQRRDSDYVPFVPLPADMFSKPQNSNAGLQAPDKEDPTFSKDDNSLAPSLGSPTERRNSEESPGAAERWPEKVAEFDSATDLSSKISGEDFPDIMPMRKGENRFVISKKKDRSLTSPQYKRRIALEQANNSNFVPFVPFPPDYFAKKDKQPEAPPSTESTPEGSQPFEKVPSPETNINTSQAAERQPTTQSNNESWWGTNLPPKYLNEGKAGYGDRGMASTLAHQPNVSGYNYNKETWDSGYSNKSTPSSGISSVNSQQSSSNSGEGWNRGVSGKSLEGSAVKETDPLDMSEEAKAERWFRRAAQIKDISELANIPDEDFPEIMPMRKGVNRFVVSKRKTPLERRLTSPQYRRNLPIVSSEPEKDTS